MGCQAKTIHDRVCKIPTKKAYCHIHKIKQSIVYRDNCKLVNEMNKMVSDDLHNEKLFNNQKDLLNKFSKKNDQLKTEIKHLNKSLEKKNKIIQDKDIQIDKLSNKSKKYMQDIINIFDQIEKMETDYNNYQVIKEFERLKNQLEKQNIDIYNYDNSYYHQLRVKRNYIVHEAILIDTN